MNLPSEHNPANPNPWYALYLDQMTPLSDEVKAAWLKDSSSKSRQFVLPIVRPLARTAIVLIQLLKTMAPSRWQSSKRLHQLIVWGLKNFASPEANWFIMRHFHLGAEIQRFILDNIPDIKIPELYPMRFRTLDELKEDGFLRHDLNLYNFIIELNLVLRRQNRVITAPEKLDFSAITEGTFPLQKMPEGHWNCVDIQTAIELYTPAYQLFLTDSDFWRAVNSLQLDETIALYVARIINDPLPVMLVNNRHPMIPHSTLRAGFRLNLHGLSTEMLHQYLVQLKRKQEQGNQPTNEV